MKTTTEQTKPDNNDNTPSMNPSMNPTISAKPTDAKAKRKPWNVVKGACRNIPIYSWKRGDRPVYQVYEGSDPLKTTTNKQNILEFAKVLADTPARLAPTLKDVKPALLASAAEAILKLEAVLKPLDQSIATGIEEYAYIKARTGKVGLRDLFDGLSTGDPASNGVMPAAERLIEISAAIKTLRPILAPLEVTIASGIEEYAAVKAKAGKEDLRKLFQVLLSTDWVKKSRTPINAVVEQFVAAKKDEAGVRDEYHRGLYYTLSRAVEAVGKNTPIGDVTTEQLKPIVFDPKREARSNKTYRTNLRTFFKWCQLHQYLDYSQPTAADRIEKIIVPRPAPRILTVAEAKAILSAVENPWCILYLALSLFTGIRHDELERLTFDLIKPGILEITAEISKTRKRRIIPLQPNLEAWLAPFRGRRGVVIPIVHVQTKVNRFLMRASEMGLPTRWPRNCLRQSYASYRLAQTGKVLQTAQENGHYAYILESIYLNLSNEADALAFFSLTPEACGKPDWKNQTTEFLKTQPELEKWPQKEKHWKPIGGKDPQIAPLTEGQPAELAA